MQELFANLFWPSTRTTNFMYSWLTDFRSTSTFRPRSSRPFWLKTWEFPDFDSVAFKYGILELNTNVKPTFLKRLIALGMQQVIYFDPDILVCSALDPIFNALDESTILITPHCTSPNEGNPHGELLLLNAGVFNLGFIAVSKSKESERFSVMVGASMPLPSGYDERWSGLFVDQKWINLVPCYFEGVRVFKHPGCNVAYWNLHERILSRGARELVCE